MILRTPGSYNSKSPPSRGLMLSSFCDTRYTTHMAFETPGFKETILSPKDMWKECKDLPPDTWHEKLYYLASKNERGIAPITVKVGRDEDESRLVFLFRINADNVFAAYSAQREPNSDDADIFGSYTYTQLQAVITQLAGKNAGFVEIEDKKKPEIAAAPAPAPVERRLPAQESLKDRMTRLRREAFHEYHERIKERRSTAGFEGRIPGIILKGYNADEKLFDKIRSIQQADPRKYWGNPAIELRCEKSLPFDVTVKSVEEGVEKTVKTLVIRVLYGTHTTQDRNAIAPLYDKHIDTLAAFYEQLKNLDKPGSLLRTTLQEAEFKQVRLEFAARIAYPGDRESAEYRIIKIDEAKVPEPVRR